MSKPFLITEEEKNQIKGLYEALDIKLELDRLNSPYAQDTKKWQEFFNKYYKLNLPVDGNWTSTNYNNAMKRYIEEKKFPVYVCKKGDGYCNDESEGQVTTKQRGLNDLMKQDMAKLNGVTSGTTSTQQAKINTTFDKTYDYKLENGKYFYSRKGANQWVEATGKGLTAIQAKVKF